MNGSVYERLVDHALDSATGVCADRCIAARRAIVWDPDGILLSDEAIVTWDAGLGLRAWWVEISNRVEPHILELGDDKWQADCLTAPGYKIVHRPGGHKVMWDNDDEP
jgi:hypothetical protein